MLIPLKKFEIITNLPFELVVSRISENIIPKDFRFFITHPSKKYLGTFLYNKFRIYRVQTSFRNKNFPIIFGTIIEEDGFVKVKIKMRPSIISLTLMFIFFSVFFISCVVMIIGEMERLKNQPNSTLSEKVVLMVLAFFGIYTINLGIFQYEVSDTKDFIKDLLKNK